VVLATTLARVGQLGGAVDTAAAIVCLWAFVGVVTDHGLRFFFFFHLGCKQHERTVEQLPADLISTAAAAFS
jgi:hypothetical protein